MQETAMTSSTLIEPNRQAASSEAGFSLMELMITTFLTLIVLASALGALDDGLMMQETAGLSSEMNHNLRSAMNEMTRDFLQAGQGIPTGGVPVPNGAGTTAIARPGPGSLTFPAGTQVLPAVATGNALGPIVLGLSTDLVSVLYADTTLDLDVTPLAGIAGNGSTMTVDAGTDITQPGNALATGDLIMFANAFGHAVQMITSVSGGQTVTFAASDSMNVNQRSAPAGSIMQLQDGPSSFPPTTATRIRMITYYIDDSVAGSPRLMKAINNGTPRPIAMEIEGLQLTYDIVDGFTNPSAVDEPVPPNSESQIRKANIALVARSYKAHRVTGQFQRQMLTSQVSLRSLSFFDRYL